MRKLVFTFFLSVSFNLTNAEQVEQAEVDCGNRLTEQVEVFIEDCKRSAEWAQCLETKFSKELHFNRNIQALKNMGYRLQDAAKRTSQEASREICARGSASQNDITHK